MIELGKKGGVARDGLEGVGIRLLARLLAQFGVVERPYRSPFGQRGERRKHFFLVYAELLGYLCGLDPAVALHAVEDLRRDVLIDGLHAADSVVPAQ